MTPEFSRLLDTNVLLQGPKTFSLSAGEEEKVAVAKRLALISLQSFVADLTVYEPTKKQPSMRLDVVLKAELVQTCVVSLKDVAEHVKESFSFLISKDPEPEESLDDDQLMALAQEEAETLYVGEAGIFDMGEILVQYLSLSMNPYPRHQDAVFTAVLDGEADGNPFSKLKNFSDNLKNN